MIGIFFMAVILFNCCTHLYFLMTEVCGGLRTKCK
jgi:hypothetical protein